MKTRYRNVAFLVELIINILVFSISCAVLVGLLGKAGEIAGQTQQESFAANQVQVIIETAKAGGAENLPGAVPQQDGSFVCGYDSNWQPAEVNEAEYTVRLTVEQSVTDAGVLYTLVATAQTAEDGQEICRMQTATYTPQAA